MPQYPFGSGALWIERTDAVNDGIGPVQVGVLQECSITADATIKELRGQMTFPDDLAISERRLTVTARHGRVFGAMWADAVFGTSTAAGQTTVAADEQSAIGATVTVANAADFLLDLGVFNASDGTRMTRVAATPAVGEYAVDPDTGIYTFNATDVTSAFDVKISYAYSLATGLITTIVNEFQGVLPVFKATFYTRRFGINSNSLVWTLNACVCSQITMPARMGEYNIPNLNFQAFSDASGVVGTISTTE
jgi:hypothetical protein